MTKTQKLEAALRWALENGARWSPYSNVVYDHGCGCCSGELDIPEEFRDIVVAAHSSPSAGEKHAD